MLAIHSNLLLLGGEEFLNPSDEFARDTIATQLSQESFVQGSIKCLVEVQIQNVNWVSLFYHLSPILWSFEELSAA